MKVSYVNTLNPVLALRIFGQSVWLDYVGRSFIRSGALQRLVTEDGLSGLLFNPSIFERAITGSADYADALHALSQQPDLNAQERYEQVLIEDIQTAADILHPVYLRTRRRDGYVSLEVSPHVARDVTRLCDEACRLWNRVGRDNLMMKVPATAEGVEAMEHLLGDGINVNATLIFCQETFDAVAEAYLLGLERFASRGGDLGGLAGVASVFLSPVDAAVDAAIAACLDAAPDERAQTTLAALQGTIAVANAKLIYHSSRARFSGARWEGLAQRGALSPRVLWASTSMKNPRYRDVLYVEELIGPETVTALPPSTYAAFRDHGQPQHRLGAGLGEAASALLALERAGISMQTLADRLLDEGLQESSEAYDRLLATVDQETRQPS